MKKNSPKLFNLAALTSPQSIVLASNVQTYTFYGNLTLSAPFAIQATGTPVEGMECFMVFTGAVTPASNAFSIFGTAINPQVIVNPWLAWCKYTNSAWIIVYWNFASKGADGIGIVVDTNGNYGIKPLGIVASMINADAAIPVSALASLTASQIAAFDGSGFLQSLAVDTYPSLVELAFVKGLTDAAQTQLTAITGAAVTLAGRVTVNEGDITSLKASRTTDEGNISTLQGQMTTAQGDVSTLQGQMTGALAGTKTYTTISGNTTLTSATIKQNIRIDASAGAVDLTLPLANTLPVGYEVHIRVFGANVVRLLCQGSDNIVSLANVSAANYTITGAGTVLDVICDHSSLYYTT